MSVRKRSHSAPATLCRPSSRPSKRKQWTEESMTAALKADPSKLYIEDGSSVSRASRDFGVPRSTLHDRVSGRVVHGVKPGPKPYLDNTEEKELGSYLKHCAKVGYGKTRKDVLCIVESATSERCRLRASHVSDGWWRRFKERQGDLSLRQGDSTAHVRMDAMNQETIDHYFSLLKDTLSTHALLDKPSQIYNVDESGVTLNPRPPKVVTTRGRVTKKQKVLAKQVPRLGLLLTNKLKKQKVTHPHAAQGQVSSHHRRRLELKRTQLTRVGAVCVSLLMKTMSRKGLERTG